MLKSVLTKCNHRSLLCLEKRCSLSFMGMNSFSSGFFFFLLFFTFVCVCIQLQDYFYRHDWFCFLFLFFLMCLCAYNYTITCDFETPLLIICYVWWVRIEGR